MVYITDDNWGEIKEFLLFKRDERLRPVHSENMRDFFHFLEMMKSLRIDLRTINEATTEYNTTFSQYQGFLFDDNGGFIADFNDFNEDDYDEDTLAISYIENYLETH